MSIVLITGPANAGKARAVLDGVRSHAARGEEPLLVVPTHADIERYRRELAEAGLVLGVRVERFQGLLAEIVQRARLGGRRPLSPLLRERVLAAVAARCSAAPELATRPGSVRALAGLIAELEVARVTPRRLRGALATWSAAGAGARSVGGGATREVGTSGVGAGEVGTSGVGMSEMGTTAVGPRSARAEELSVLFEGYHELLAELGRSDPDGRAALALDALRRDPALWGATPVLLYGFDDLTRLQLDAVETLGRVVDAPLTVSLPYEPGRVAFAGRASAFQTLLPWVSEHRRLEARAEYYAPQARAALHHLERGLFESAAGRPSDPAGAVRLLEGGSPRAELELVAGEIRALLDRGMAPGEIAIAHRSPGAVAELLTEVLESFDVPFAIPRRLPFGHTALGRALCGLLAAACGGQPGMPEPGRLEDLLAWLRAPGLLERPELADRLEAVARRTGVFSATHACALWEAEQWPLNTLDHVLAAARGGPLELVERTLSELRRLFAAPRRRAAQVLADGPELEEAAALVGATRALEELAELSRLAPRLGPSPEALVAILQDLEIDLERHGGGQVAIPHGLASTGGELSGLSFADDADAVAVLDPLALRARRVRALFLCGVQADVFPAPARPEPVLSEEERRSLAEASGLRLSAPRQALAAERYLLYAAVSRPEELLVLSWHTAGDDGEPTAPSLFLEDVCDLFCVELRNTCAQRPAGAASWPGPVSDPCALPPAWAAREPILAAPRCSPPALRPLRDERLLEELRAERLWSASSLETWTGCPARWFVERLLRARDLDPDPEPLARGGLAHAALRDTLEGLRARFGSARLTPAHLDCARELLHEALARHARDFPLSVSPERIPGVRRRLEADLERYLEHAAGTASVERAVSDAPTGRAVGAASMERAVGAASTEHAAGTASKGRQQSPLEPAYLELSFGFADGLPALDLGEGVQLRGRIDRIDIAPSGDAVVYDYKGSQAPPADRWVADGHLQMAIYMRAAEQLLRRPVVGGFYQPLSSRDLRARGVLCAEADLELDCVRGDEREQADVQALLHDTLGLAREAAREADAGALEARPGTCAFGDGGCMYPSICRCER